jgi:hypothetical protein
MMMRRLFTTVLAACLIAACNGTTGDKLIYFSAYASGVPGASDPFTVGAFTVQITSAKLWIGGVYVNSSVPNPGSQGTSCTQPGLYVVQVPGGVDVDLLSTTPQEFSYYGDGTADVGQSWELWLVNGDVNNESNPSPPNIVDLQAVATRTSDQATFSFGATVNINQNRITPASSPAVPGEFPICQRRIVEVSPVDVPFFQGGTLHVTVDPRAWFGSLLDVDFSQLPGVATAVCQKDPSSDYGSSDYCIPDDDDATGADCSSDCAEAGRQFFTGIRSAGSRAYALSYTR